MPQLSTNAYVYGNIAYGRCEVSAQLTQRDRAAAVCYAYVRNVHCAVVRMVRTTGTLLSFSLSLTVETS